MANIVPAWSEVMKADEEITKISEQVKGPVEKFTGKNYETFKPISYRSQTVFQFVNGINYLIKIYVGEEKYIHVMVFKPLPSGAIELSGVQENKTKDDPLEPFNN